MFFQRIKTPGIAHVAYMIGNGHGISGTMQLAVSSWISVVCFFAGGALTASALYRL